MSDANESLKHTLGEMENAARKIGLYVQDVHIAATDPEKGPAAMAEGDALRALVADEDDDCLVMVAFVLGDVAFSKRVLDPEQDKIDDEVRQILPDPVEELKEKMRRAAEEGRSVFDAMNDDDDDLG
jgi:hypothetical protein